MKPDTNSQILASPYSSIRRPDPKLLALMGDGQTPFVNIATFASDTFIKMLVYAHSAMEDKKQLAVWVDPIPRPAQISHNPDAPAIGRVRSATVTQFKNNLRASNAAGKFPYNWTHNEPDIKPEKFAAGELILLTDITDMDALDRIIDKRLLDVSAGFNFGRAIRNGEIRSSWDGTPMEQSWFGFRSTRPKGKEDDEAWEPHHSGDVMRVKGRGRVRVHTVAPIAMHMDPIHVAFVGYGAYKHARALDVGGLEASEAIEYECKPSHFFGEDSGTFLCCQDGKVIELAEGQEVSDAFGTDTADVIYASVEDGASEELATGRVTVYAKPQSNATDRNLRDSSDENAADEDQSGSGGNNMGAKNADGTPELTADEIAAKAQKDEEAKAALAAAGAPESEDETDDVEGTEDGSEGADESNANDEGSEGSSDEGTDESNADESSNESGDEESEGSGDESNSADEESSEDADPPQAPESYNAHVREALLRSTLALKTGLGLYKDIEAEEKDAQALESKDTDTIAIHCLQVLNAVEASSVSISGVVPVQDDISASEQSDGEKKGSGRALDEVAQEDSLVGGFIRFKRSIAKRKTRSGL